MSGGKAPTQTADRGVLHIYTVATNIFNEKSQAGNRPKPPTTKSNI